MNNIARKARDQKNNIISEVHEHGILIDTRELFIHGDFWSEEDAGCDFRMGNRLLKNMRILESCSKDPIIIHQHNLGGWWDSGMIMYDAIMTSPCYIIFIIHGTACSMGSVIPHAADLRLIMPSATFMIHSGTTDIEPFLTYKQARSWNEMEKKQQEEMINIYVQATESGSFFAEKGMDEKKRRKFILEQMNKHEDVWWYAEDTLKYGFVDGIVSTKGYEDIDTIRENAINGKYK